MRRLLTVYLLLLLVPAAHAAEKCNPRDYFDTDFSTLRDFERMIVLSTISQANFNKAAAAHSGEMIIPYINVPAKGDFSYTKTIVSQFHQMIASDLTALQEETILRSSLTSLGVAAYRECLNRIALSLEVAEGSLYDPFVIVEVRYNGPTNKPARIDPPFIEGGAIVSTVPTTIADEGSEALMIRRNLDQKLVLALVVHQEGDIDNQEPSLFDQLQLPARQRKSLKMAPYRFPASTSLNVFSGHPNYGPVETTECYDAPDGVRFIAATAEPIIESLHGADMGSKFEVRADSTGLRVCARAYANAAVKHRGAQASGWVSVVGTSLVDIQYPPGAPATTGDYDLAP